MCWIVFLSILPPSFNSLQLLLSPLYSFCSSRGGCTNLFHFFCLVLVVALFFLPHTYFSNLFYPFSFLVSLCFISLLMFLFLIMSRFIFPPFLRRYFISAVFISVSIIFRRVWFSDEMVIMSQHSILYKESYILVDLFAGSQLFPSSVTVLPNSFQCYGLQFLCYFGYLFVVHL